MLPLESAVDRTLRWFAMFSQPLTAFETWKWLYAPEGPVSLIQVREALESGEGLQGRICFLDGFYAPAGQVEDFVRIRRERHACAIGKYRQLRRAVHAWARVPGVRAVAAANTLAWWNTREDSDIDVLVVTDAGALWRARALLVTPYALAGRRPGARRASRGAFDFSFFLSSEALDLSRFALQGGDPYLAYWTASLVPIHDPEGWFPRLWDANAWVRSQLPNAFSTGVSHSSVDLKHFNRSIPEPVGSMLERAAKGFQSAYFPPAIRSRLNRDTCVVADATALKFHVNDRREAYRDAWKAAAYDA